MAITNFERVTKAMDLLRNGLAPFVEREFRNVYPDNTEEEALNYIRDDRNLAGKTFAEWDVAALLKLMWNSWQSVYRKALGRTERSIVSELQDYRNNWAHQNTFTGDDTYRVLDSAHRLMLAISAAEADDLDKMKAELLRIRFDEQVRSEKRKSSGGAIESAAVGHLVSWRDVVTPHKDVASGRYNQAEFAADLWQVYLGEGTDEYRNPVEFFRRTHLTDSLMRMLVGAVRRLTGNDNSGDPVVQLQTNFGGGKTHSMLALFHLFSGIKPSELVGIDAVMAEAEAKSLPKVNRAVLVGNKISPGNPTVKPDGTVVRTLWGELAWQIGGREAYNLIAKDDELATSPGDKLREIFNTYGPCLVLIDEWVAYARQLHDKSDLPAGSFETQFSFAQALTESAKLAHNCMLVISLPASDTAGSPHTQADDIEVGGIRGREALDRLRNVVGRVESSWRPATAEEGFEIVRRRLFEPMIEPDQFKQRDVVARAFYDMYRTQHQEFPLECRDADYEKRIKAAYPIHPEIFDRLYSDWSTLVKFQRTRGVLRLMASVIHSLWEKGDRNPLILPSMIPIDDQRVKFELTRYLSDNWTPVIERDVDGPNSLPLRIDGEVPNLGKLHACRRVARTVYLGSAPIQKAAHLGIEDRRIKLGCIMPGESPAVFGDALRRLASSATYLYQDGPRVWYSTQPTVTKLAEDRAEQLKRDPDKVIAELDKRLRNDLRRTGEFERIHPLPHSGADVPDDFNARLVVLGTDHPHSKEAISPAIEAAKAILESRGNSPRLYRNTLVFLAVDRTRLQDLDEAIRKYIAWDSILAERETLDLSPFQVKQAETQRSAADGAVTARLPEAYQWLLVPEQKNARDVIEWQAIRLTGNDALAVRASKKLRNDELLIFQLGGTILRKYLDEIPLWRGDRVEIRQLCDDFSRYLYLPRLISPAVLVNAIREGLGLLTWETDTYAFADSYDEAAKRYTGLRSGHNITITEYTPQGLLVKSSVARKQMDAEQPAPQKPIEVTVSDGVTVNDIPEGIVGGKSNSPSTPSVAEDNKPRRYYGTVQLDPARVGRDASRIAEEVISHLVGLVGADVKVTLEIEANLPEGAPEQVVRIVTENGITLRFTSHGFEKE